MEIIEIIRDWHYITIVTSKTIIILYHVWNEDCYFLSYSFLSFQAPGHRRILLPTHYQVSMRNKFKRTL